MIHWLSTGLVTVLLLFLILSTFPTKTKKPDQIVPQTLVAVNFEINLNQQLFSVK